MDVFDIVVRCDMFSFIIPTRNEFHSISSVVSSLCQSIAGNDNEKSRPEVLIIDDSDGWDTVNAAYHTAAAWPTVKFSALHRPPDRRDGLTGAILTGLQTAEHDRAVVMDGDGQHPPSAAAEIAGRLADGWDLVFGSRYRLADGDSGLSNRARRAGSRFVNARLRASLKLGPDCTDPLTGLFGVDRSQIRLPTSGHGGWKAAFLILARNRRSARFTEVGYRMEKRAAGQSKLNPITALRILWELHKARAGEVEP